MMEEQNKVLQGLVSIVQTMLAADMEQGTVTPMLIAEKVDFVADNLYRGKDIDRKEAVAELIRRFSLWIGGATKLSDMTDTRIGSQLLVERIGATGNVTAIFWSGICRSKPLTP